jgi:hypothetical protein
MTITAPKRTTIILNVCIGVCIALIAISAGTTVVLYNRLVSARHDIEDAITRRGDRSAANAELKNTLLTRLDGTTLEALARERNLTKDANPYYLTDHGLASRQ